MPDSKVYQLTVNGAVFTVNTTPDTPLLWILREQLGLTGTKPGCHIGQCGACMVHVDGAPVTSCLAAIGDVAGKRITTIEGLGAEGLSAVQRAWVEENVPQCGYCQSGQIMAATSLLQSNPKPTDHDIDVAMDKVLCRCGTYQRIRRAIHRASALMRTGVKK